MKNRDLFSGLFWIVFGIFFAVGGLKLGLVRQGIPGPGSLPLIVGLVLAGLAAILVIQALVRKPLFQEKIFGDRGAGLKLGLALGSLVAYGLLLKTLGFLLTTFLFLLFVVRFVSRERWATAAVFSLLTALVFFGLFTALQVNLPAGRIGF